MESVVTIASVELVVVFKTKDEVVLIGAIEVDANGTGGGSGWRVVFLGAEDDIGRRETG